MKEIEIKLKIKSNEANSSIEASINHKEDITLNEFCSIIDRFKGTYVSAIQKHCRNNNIDIEEFVLNTTLTEFYKLLNNK